MNEKYDVTQISGYENMDEEDKKYFERYGNEIIDQAELIAKQHQIDLKSINDDFERYINSLNNFDNEYIVEGARLKCTMCTRKTQRLILQDRTVIESRPFHELDYRSRLTISEDRQEKINGQNPAKVTDTSGGLQGNKTNTDINIKSFGNCDFLKDGDKLEDVVRKLYNLQSIFEDKYISEIANEFARAIREGKGTCYCLMQLSNKWDNFPDDYDYAGGIFKYETGNNKNAGAFDRRNPYMKFNDEEGINMLSMLFCIRGGIITACESGQKVQVSGVSDRLIELLKKYETGMNKYGELLQEGLPALNTYHGADDPANVNTIGWGHAMHDKDDGKFQFKNEKTQKSMYPIGSGITFDQAEQLLRYDIAEREKKINEELQKRGISDKINQQFYDALFLLYYQIPGCFQDNDFPSFLDSGNFDPVNNAQEIMEQFGEYTNHGSQGTMRRRADELDIILYGDYERDYDETRYGDIWTKKTAPNSVTPGY